MVTRATVRRGWLLGGLAWLMTASAGSAQTYPMRPATDPRLTLHFVNTPLREALRRVFAPSERLHAVEPSVPDVPINLRVRRMPFAPTLRLLIRLAKAQVPGLSQDRDGNVYIIRIRGTLNPDMPPTAVPWPKTAWSRIRVQRRDAADLALQLGGAILSDFPAQPDALPRGSWVAWPAGAPPHFGMELTPRTGIPLGLEAILAIPVDGHLMVRGSPEDVEKLEEHVRKLDAPRRQVEMRLSAAGLTAAGWVADGASLRLSDGAGKDRLDVTLTPNVSESGEIDIGVDGWLTVGGERRELKTRARLKAGQPAPVLTLGEGSRQVRVWLRAAPMQE